MAKRYFIEQSASIPEGDDPSDHVLAHKAITGCVFAYARKSTAGDGPADTVVSIHEVEGSSICQGQRQRRVYLPESAA